MLLGLTTILDSTLQDTKSQQTANYQTLFSNAAKRYLNDNYATLLKDITFPVDSTTTRSLNDLLAYLPASFTTTNAYQQTPCMLVRKTSSAQLEVLLVTEGGTEISDADIGYVAANAGAGGGTITRDPASGKLIARGAYGSWTLSNSTGAPNLSDFLTAKCSAYPAGIGHLATALFYGAGQSRADFVYRHDIGNATYNTMSAPIRMADNALQLANNPCGSTPAMAMEQGTGKILTCDLTSHKWTNQQLANSNWKDPVPGFASPPPTATTDDVYVAVNDGIAHVKGTAGWYPLGQDKNGGLEVPGSLKDHKDAWIMSGNVHVGNTFSAQTFSCTDHRGGICD
ncbi:shufflon system plasmid conjugative transfer pilus tip adhesin PilV [Actimicrobium sp. CCI2.3]|uniref:shufflon system plasmid conjugative transfer pilus tip adhesin PilV n=1 Tax=Actimicrobium sp. CCI2.3 TaxID=3048616 RepID=UPI002AB35A4F|nr:shufflon system plasmid conjugative transfer pilus tip adhesin PilV [Actimicrobium sp. CCI2.3]MDY7573512.1 shufflon system plasmid conjugative transfer pilus tip adhesin PilV [Actimicrobium sp. CCI2.3]MEB0022693.1 shufflon system plasmid conjugative transfer pilus tip adhesin PilV [Actimicrobium sp. CCI2.3]